MFTNVGSMGRFKKINSVIIADVFEGLVSRWNFEEASGTTVADSWGSNNGTASGGMTWETGKVDDYAGGFNGSTQYVSIPDSLDLRLQELTISVWIKVDVIGAYQGIVAKPHAIGGYNSWYLRVANDGKLNWTVQNGTLAQYGVWTTSDVVIVPGTWHHIVATYKKNNLDISDGGVYVDGIAVSSVLAGNPILSNFSVLYDTTALLIGEQTVGSGLNFDGDIDDVRIYNRDLSASEVSRIYNKYA